MRKRSLNHMVAAGVRLRVLAVLIRTSLPLSGLETDLENVGLKNNSLAAAAGHFLRDVFGRRAQVRSLWEACSVCLMRSVPLNYCSQKVLRPRYSLRLSVSGAWPAGTRSSGNVSAGGHYVAPGRWGSWRWSGERSSVAALSSVSLTDAFVELV